MNTNIVFGQGSIEQWRAFAEQNPTTNPGQLVEKAIQKGKVEVVQWGLQNENIDINQPCDPQQYGSRSPLLAALHADNPQMVSLIASQPHFDLAKSLPEFERWIWARNATLEVLQQFLEIPGTDINQKDCNGKTLLHEIVYDIRSFDKIKLLLSLERIIIDAKQSDGTTPLYHAGLAGNIQAFELLIDHGADVNTRNNDNLWSILMCAIANNKIEIVQRLLNRPGTDVNTKDDLQRTPLHIAAEYGRSQIFGLLLERAEIQINSKDHLGWTPLIKACFFGNDTIVKMLIDRVDLEVNFVDQSRQTALFHAASIGNTKIVHMLLADPRVNIAITNRPAHLTALEMAKALGHTDIVTFLTQKETNKDVLSSNDPYVEQNAIQENKQIIRPPIRKSKK